MMISISVVSHGQMGLILNLMKDLEKFCSNQPIELILTLNIPENIELDKDVFSYTIKVIENKTQKGFGANHNQAFERAQGDFFCVVNPDIRLHDCPISALIRCLQNGGVGTVAPRVLSPSGSVEDSARTFPTFQKIVRKLVRRVYAPDYPLHGDCVDVDWVAGMFMVFTHAVFDQIDGFNERYFLYYEDVDLCARLHLAGLRVVVLPDVQVVHHAQRSSHRSLKYLRWHAASLMRFLTSPEYRQLKRLHRL
ncbi:glycosyltransferase [Rhodoferax sp.]|uniref:glycosyltransferase n=1 Tax=Rhodoferax sp. TaxID=50421 RepID=UPI0028474B29|nr:glycosyltransferase [Rhodoferax sp.]MDR3371564.1 glycosyltransferase [Rhodoferax sp.]